MAQFATEPAVCGLGGMLRPTTRPPPPAMASTCEFTPSIPSSLILFFLGIVCSSSSLLLPRRPSAPTAQFLPHPRMHTQSPVGVSASRQILHYVRARAWCEWEDFDLWPDRVRAELEREDGAVWPPFLLLAMPGMNTSARSCRNRPMARGQRTARTLACTRDRSRADSRLSGCCRHRCNPQTSSSRNLRSFVPRLARGKPSKGTLASH